MKITIPGYQIKKKIGSGAMGHVFLAEQVSLGRLVAIKVLFPNLSEDKSYISRFLREIRLVARLRHENIVGGIDAGEVDGVYYLVMEYIDGEPVKKLLKTGGRMPETKVIPIVAQIARALEQIHANGLIHRDVKPGNILLSPDGRAKLCDLGLAKDHVVDPGITLAGTTVGTPHYMAPEQIRGESAIDIRSDIYSLGATAYHMLTGRTPYLADNADAILRKHLFEEIVPPRERCPDISDKTNRLVMKMLAKDRNSRFQTPGEILRELEKSGTAAEKKPDPVKPPPAPPRRPLFRRRVLSAEPRRFIPRFLLISMILLLALAGMLFLGILLKPTFDPRKSAEETDPTLLFQQRMETYVEKRDALLRNNAPEMTTEPWRMLTAFAEETKDPAFIATWMEERRKFEELINEKIEPLWTPFRDRMRQRMSEGKWIDALVEAKTFPEKLLSFRSPVDGRDAVRTAAGAELDELTRIIMAELQRRFDADKERALSSGESFKAWNISYDMELYAPPIAGPLHDRLLQLKATIAEGEIGGILREGVSEHQFAAARTRLKAIREINKENPHMETAAYALLTRKLTWYLSIRDYDAARTQIADFLDTSDYPPDLPDLLDALFPKVTDYYAVKEIMKNRGMDSLLASNTIDNQIRILEHSSGPPDILNLLLRARAIVSCEDLFRKAEAGIRTMRDCGETIRFKNAPETGADVRVAVREEATTRRKILVFYTGEAPEPDAAGVDFVRKNLAFFFHDEEIVAFARRSLDPNGERANQSYRGNGRMRMAAGILYLFGGDAVNAARELEEAKRIGEPFTDRYLAMTKEGGEIPKLPPQSIMALFATPPTLAGSRIDARYTFDKVADMRDWFPFNISWQSGNFRVDEGRLFCTGSVGFVWKGRLVGDASIEMELILRSGDQLTLLLFTGPGAEQETGYAGVIRETADPSHPQAISRQEEISYATIAKTSYLSAPCSQLAWGDPPVRIAVKFEKRGEEIALFINGDKAAVGKDASLSSGIVGFRTFHTDLEIDNIRITGILE